MQRNLRTFVRTLVALLLILLLRATADGQGTNASIVGTVTDESRAALPGVTIVAVNTETGFTRESITTETGTYRLAALAPGRYNVKATIPGFADQTREGLTLVVIQEQRLDFTLHLATVQETVTVIAGPPIIELTRSEVSGAVLQDQIMALPVNSRQFTDLALLLPGANADQRREWSDPVNIGAGAWHQTSFVMDGANNVWAATGESRMNFTQEAVREFKVITSGFKAEYGNSATGVVIGVSKSGTNDFHGSAFEFFRDKSLNAKAAFEKEKQDYRRHQFGGTFGGPILRDRMFVFGAVERLSERSFVNLSTGGVYPTLDGQYEVPITQTLGTFRFDAALSATHTAFVRWALQRKDWLNQGVGGRSHPSSQRDLNYPRDSVVAGLTSVFGNNVNDFRVGWGFTRALKSPAEGTVVGYRFPSLSYGGGGWETEWEKRIEFSDDFFFYKAGWGGEHNFKTGVSLNPYIPMRVDFWGCEAGCYSFAVDSPGFPVVPVNFEAMAAAGRIQRLTVGIRALGPEVNYPLYGAYFQDDWKPARDLTVNLGVRWDAQWNTMVQEVDGGPGPLNGSFYIPGVYDRTTRKRDLNNIAPRFGFAYDVGGRGKTVVRGNTGIFYAQIPNLPLYFEQLYQDGFNTNAVDIDRPRLTNWTEPTSELGDPKRFVSGSLTTTLNGNDLQNPSAYQMGIGFSHQIMPTMGLDVDYVRMKGRDELLPRNMNLPDPATGRFLTDAFGVVTIYETDGRSLYNALLVKLEKRMSHKLQFMASYTLAKADNTSSSIYTSAADSRRLEDEWGPGPADRRQRFVFSGITTALPYNLQFSGVLSVASSRPFDIRAGRDLSGDRDFSDRPPGITRNQGCRDLDLDRVNAFRQANGVGAVTAVDCQGRMSLDVRLSKSFRFSSARRLEVLFEVFNLTNAENLEHAQGQAVQTDQALSSTFGQGILAGAPRQAALAARFVF